MRNFINKPQFFELVQKIGVCLYNIKYLAVIFKLSDNMLSLSFSKTSMGAAPMEQFTI